MNEGNIIGIVGKNSIRFAPDNVKPTVLEFNICFREKNTKNEDEWNFFQVKMFGEQKIDKLLQMGFVEGDRILVNYSLKNNSYTDKTGKKKTVYYLMAREIHKIGGGNTQMTSYNTTTPQEQYQNTWANGIDIDNDSLPF